VVYVIDEDDSVRNALSRLIRSAGMEAYLFGSVDEFLRSDYRRRSGSLVVDVHLLEGSGFDLKACLDQAGCRYPIIFMTAQDSRKTREEALRMGAFSYLKKPFDDRELFDVISAAHSGTGSGSPVS
jgi:FixJ family two-component response regulator